MTTENPFKESHHENKPSSLLSITTILSLIGSSAALVTAVTTYINAEANYEKIKNFASAEDIAKAPAFVKSFINENTLVMAQKAVENKLPIMIITLIGAVLCLIGALLMRRLKKDGLKLWLTGEIMPLASNVVFLGFASMSGIAGFINLLFPVIFMTIYMVCRKELVN